MTPSVEVTMLVVSGAEVAAYVGARLKITIGEPGLALGFLTDDRRPLAAAVLNDFNGANIELTIVAERGGITRGVVRYLAAYVFGQLGCRRLTVRVKRRNRHALRMAERAGFRFEAVAKSYFADDDAIVFRMLKQDCRWIP